MASKLIIHGFTGGLFGGKLKLYFNGAELGVVAARSKQIFDLPSGGHLTAKCGINPNHGELDIEDNTITEVQTLFQKGNYIVLQAVDVQQIDTAQDKEGEKPVYALEGVRGRRMDVYEDRAVIKTRVTIGSILSSNASDGEKTIYYADCIGVQFKEAGFQIGYIQLETASAIMNNKGDNFFNENSFTFGSAEENIPMRKVANYIQERIRECKRPQASTVVTSAPLSAADEIKKFKELLDMGIITQEEFDAKKKELLGI